MERGLTGPEIHHVGVSPQSDVVREVPPQMIRILIDHLLTASARLRLAFTSALHNCSVSISGPAAH